MSNEPVDTVTGLPVRLLHDRLLVREDPGSERRSSGGIVIPATASVGRRLAWAETIAIGPLVNSVEKGDRVMYDPEDASEVEVGAKTYILLRERDIHAVAAPRIEPESTGLYLLWISTLTHQLPTHPTSL